MRRLRSGWLKVAAPIAFLHAAGWLTLLAAVMPEHLGIGARALGAGTGLTAYLLGVRHAFDADHIAAIDNSIRKLLRDGQPSRSVGLWFAMGHSSVVLALTLLVSQGARQLSSLLTDGSSPLHDLAGLAGSLISIGFLYLIASVNLFSLGGLWGAIRHAKSGGNALSGRDAQRPAGPMAWILRPAMSLVGKPWHMGVVGFLFGLGFDTASEVTLLVLAGTGVATGLPAYAILCLPLLFGAGMTLCDTLNSLLMVSAYGWAGGGPVRRLWYDFALTALSAAIGLAVGTFELAGLVGERIPGTPWQGLASMDLTDVGIGVAALFLVVWSAATLIRSRSAQRASTTAP